MRALSTVLTVLSLCAAGAAGATCQLAKYDIPVRISGMRALRKANINGTNDEFMLDSGAFYSYPH
jgi:hypothetical protein